MPATTRNRGMGLAVVAVVSVWLGSALPGAVAEQRIPDHGNRTAALPTFPPQRPVPLAMLLLPPPRPDVPAPAGLPASVPATTIPYPFLPPGAPRVSSQVVETVAVSARDSLGTHSGQVYQAGRVYDFYVTGRYSYGNGPSLADAECSQGPGDTSYQPARYGSRKLDLTLNGFEFQWTPTGEGACDETSTYRLTVAASGTGLVTFRIEDDSYGDNYGALSVTAITRPDHDAVPNLGPEAALIETMLLDPRDPLGSVTAHRLEYGRTYEFVATGQWDWGGGGADAECSWSTEPTSDLGEDLDLTVNTADVIWKPLGGGAEPCSPDLHTYHWSVAPTRGGGYPLLRIRDDGGHADNSGLLVVFIYEVR